MTANPRYSHLLPSHHTPFEDTRGRSRSQDGLVDNGLNFQQSRTPSQHPAPGIFETPRGRNPREMGAATDAANTRSFMETPAFSPGVPPQMQNLVESRKSGPQSSVRSNTSVRHLIYAWRWELFTWTLGTAGFLSIVILYRVFDGSLQSDWKSNIQITAFAAALAQLSQSALLVPISSSIGQLKWRWIHRADRSTYADDITEFDNASRGPYGSGRLLWHFALKQHLVSLGAIATILLLAFPTFVQQAVQLGTRENSHEGEKFAFVQRATTYRPLMTQNPYYDNMEQSTWFALGGLDAYLKNTIDSGLLATKVTPSNITGYCETSKCSWEPYNTLSICSKIEDVTDMLFFNDSAIGRDTPHVKLPGENSTKTTYKMPYQVKDESNFNVQGRFFQADQVDYAELGAEVGKVLKMRPTPNGTQSKMSDLAHVYVSYFDPCAVRDKENFKDKAPWKAHKATFNICIQSFNSSIDSTGMNTTTRRTYDDITWKREVVDGNLPIRRQTTSPQFYQYCADVPNSDESFCIGERSLQRIGGQLISALDISASFDVPGGHNYIYSEWAAVLGTDMLGLDPGVCGNETVRGFDGYSHRMENIAASLTNGLRLANSSSKVPGTSYETQHIIIVNYYWLIFPALLYIVVTTFFFTTLIQTRHLPPWKSSPLALLWGKDDSADLRTAEKIKKLSLATKVQLEAEGNDWRLVDNLKPQNYHD